MLTYSQRVKQLLRKNGRMDSEVVLIADPKLKKIRNFKKVHKPNRPVTRDYSFPYYMEDFTPRSDIEILPSVPQLIVGKHGHHSSMQNLEPLPEAFDHENLPTRGSLGLEHLGRSGIGSQGKGKLQRKAFHGSDINLPQSVSSRFSETLDGNFSRIDLHKDSPFRGMTTESEGRYLQTPHYVIDGVGLGVKSDRAIIHTSAKPKKINPIHRNPWDAAILDSGMYSNMNGSPVIIPGETNRSPAHGNKVRFSEEEATMSGNNKVGFSEVNTPVFSKNSAEAPQNTFMGMAPDHYGSDEEYFNDFK